MKKSLRTYACVLLASILLSPTHVLSENGFDRLIARLAEQSWVLREPVRTFSSENLYEEIDGEAELFLPYDFRQLHVAYLFEKAQPDLELRIEVYLHGSPRDAFGIFSQHRFPGQETIRIGPSEAIVSDASLDFFRGDRFIRIRASSPSSARENMIRLGRAVSGLLDGTGAPPREAEALLIKSFLPGTLVYQKKAILGYSALAPGYEAKFTIGETSGTMVLLLLHPGEGSSAASLKKIAAGIPGFERVSEGMYRAAIPGGKLWLKESGGRFIGIAGTLSGESAEGLLSEILVNLK